jgi:hypothetical protein
MSDPRGERSRDGHIQEDASSSPGGKRGDTRSETHERDPSSREAMQQELMDLGVWLSEHPESRKNLKPIRGSVILDPGVYYNTGTGMVERIYAPQHVALGARWFRVKSDPGSPLEEIRRKVLEGK